MTLNMRATAILCGGVLLLPLTSAAAFADPCDSGLVMTNGGAVASRNCRKARRWAAKEARRERQHETRLGLINLGANVLTSVINSGQRQAAPTQQRGMVVVERPMPMPQIMPRPVMPHPVMPRPVVVHAGGYGSSTVTRVICEQTAYAKRCYKEQQPIRPTVHPYAGMTPVVHPYPGLRPVAHPYPGVTPVVYQGGPGYQPGSTYAPTTTIPVSTTMPYMPQQGGHRPYETF